MAAAASAIPPTPDQQEAQEVEGEGLGEPEARLREPFGTTPDSEPLRRLRDEAEPRTLDQVYQSFKAMLDENFLCTHAITSRSEVHLVEPDRHTYVQLCNENFNSASDYTQFYWGKLLLKVR